MLHLTVLQLDLQGNQQKLAQAKAMMKDLETDLQGGSVGNVGYKGHRGPMVNMGDIELEFSSQI